MEQCTLQKMKYEHQNPTVSNMNANLYMQTRIKFWHGNEYNKNVIISVMMTSSNGNIFRVTGHLGGEFTGHRWIHHTKASDAEL